MVTGTRVRMVAGALELIRERGLNGTSVREVVRHTDTPRGSIRHHFPGGKLQLVEEALALVQRDVSLPLRRLLEEQGIQEGLRTFIGLWRQVLVKSRCSAGCPVLSVSVEQFIGEDGSPDKAAQKKLLKMADSIFRDWQQQLAAALMREGVPASRANRLAGLVVSSVEGSVALCRASRSVEPLEEVAGELEDIIAAALAAGHQNRNREQNHHA